MFYVKINWIIFLASIKDIDALITQEEPLSSSASWFKKTLLFSWILVQVVRIVCSENITILCEY